MHGLLEFNYQPEFPSDGVFYFSDALDCALIIEHLKEYIGKLQYIISEIQKHQNEVSQFIPEAAIKTANIIFNHHQSHYRAELDWAVETLNGLESNQ